MASLVFTNPLFPMFSVAAAMNNVVRDTNNLPTNVSSKFVNLTAIFDGEYQILSICGGNPDELIVTIYHGVMAITVSGSGDTNLLAGDPNNAGLFLLLFRFIARFPAELRDMGC